MAQIQSSEHEDNSVPSTEAAPPRPRRSLKKCSQCRKNRKKCLPVERVWPQVCDRCKKSGYQCSPPLLKSQDQNGVEVYDSGEDGECTEVPGQGESTSSVGGSSKDHSTSESSKGASISQILLEIGYFYLADKEMARKKMEHVCYINRDQEEGNCFICDYLLALKKNVEEQLSKRIGYAKKIAESYRKKYSNNPSNDTYPLYEAESIYAYLRDLVSGNGLNMESLYDKDTIMTHIKILKLQKNWPQAEILVERVAKQIRSPQNNRSDPIIFQEYLECLNRTSFEISRILKNCKPPGEYDAINLEFHIPALHRAITSGVLPPLELPEMKTEDRDFLSRTPIIIAAFHGKPEWISVLITHYKVDKEVTDSRGHGALEIASLRGHPTSFRLLIENGAEVNPKIFMDGATPLHAAVWSNNEDMVRRLVQLGANINQETLWDNLSPLNWARQMGTHAIRTFLEKQLDHVMPPVLRGDDDTLCDDSYLEAQREMQ